MSDSDSKPKAANGSPSPPSSTLNPTPNHPNPTPSANPNPIPTPPASTSTATPSAPIITHSNSINNSSSNGTKSTTVDTNNNNNTNNAFFQAQQRIAARREAREAAAAARQATQQSASRVRARIAASQSPLLRRLGTSTLSLWDTLTSREGTRPAFRVGQVDAELLDEELVELLRGQVKEALKYVGGGGGGSGIVQDWQDEISLALRAVLFKLTVWDHDATYGASLQNLKYTDARRSGPSLAPPTRWQKALYGLVTVGGRYLWAKWEGWLVEQQDDGFDEPSPRVRRLSRWTSALSALHAAAAFVSFLIFLLHGRYRTLLDRVLRIRLAPPTSQVSREVSFEYLNRQLVWHAFTEFLLFVLPLVGINRWRRWLARTWRKTKKIMTADSSGSNGGGGKKGEYSFLPERTCAICYQDQNSASSETELLAAGAGASSAAGVVGSAQTDITNPYEAIPCGCVYCFVCLATRIEREEGEGWTCLRCGELVKECKPWNGDVLEEQQPPEAKPSLSSSSPAATKTVVFADDVKAPSSDNGEEGEEEKQEEKQGIREQEGLGGENEGESSQVLVETDPDGSLDDLRPRTPSVASDQADDSRGSESEDYEAQEDGLGEEDQEI
ncbi:hypothetical protein VTH82DRAFT_3683 [Thermothelomyces myriococcoides]